MIKNLWVFDFDGTLSSIVFDRRAACLHPLCCTMLTQLAATEGFYTAILSSRTLDDLLPRINVKGLALGGNCGAEWLLPDGTRSSLTKDRLSSLQAARAAILPELKRIDLIDGIDIEDKNISITVHIRQVPDRYRKFVLRQLEYLKFSYELGLYEGPEAYEILLLPELSKTQGIISLCDLIGFNKEKDCLCYAGDDSHDAEVMKWVIQRGGMAFTIGPAPLVSGACAVPDPQALALEILKLINPSTAHCMANSVL
jgi:trehalose 6-phosphate phosphatase